MPYLFGMYFKSREEREKEYQEYTKKIFPYGDSQKKAVQALLKEILPKEDQTGLLMYFIQLKELLIDNPAYTPVQADASLPRRALRPRSIQGMMQIFALLDADINIDSCLSYPSSQELAEKADRYKKKYKS
ncbi:hypothetical protein AALB16_11660 [Lachnospiraceae bacterium 62-35]